MANITFSQQPDTANEILYPDGDDTTNWKPSIGTTHYSLVDDPWNNLNDTDYYTNSIVSSDIKNIHTFDNSNINNGTINFVRLIGRLKAEYASTPPTFKFLADDGSEDLGSSQTLTGTYTKYDETWSEKPSTGTWSWTDINNLKAGISGTISDLKLTYVTEDSDSSYDIFVMNNYIFRAKGSLEVLTYNVGENIFTTVDSTSGHVYVYVVEDGSTYHVFSNLPVNGAKTEGYKLRYHTFNTTTESLTFEAEYELDFSQYENTKYERMYDIFADDDYVYIVTDEPNDYDYRRIMIFEYSDDTLTLIESVNNDYATTSFRPQTGVYALDDGTDKYVFVCGEDSSHNNYIKAYTFDTSTDTLSLQDTHTEGNHENQSGKITSDDTYIYWLEADDGQSVYYLHAMSFNGTTLTEEHETSESGSVWMDNPNDVKMVDNYIVCTFDSGKVVFYTYDNSSGFTKEYTYTQLDDDNINACGSYGSYDSYLFFATDSCLEVDSFDSIFCSQLYTLVNYTPSSSTITLPLPESISMNHSRNTSRFTFPDGDYAVEDMSRAGKTLSMSGKVWNQNDVTNDLVGYWKFDTGSGTTAVDSSGNGNDGTLNGGISWVSDGKYNSCVSFDGTNDYVEISNSPEIEMSENQPMTISYWLKSEGQPSSFEATVMKHSFGSSYGHLINKGDDLLIYTDSDSSSEHSASNFMEGEYGNWVYVTQTYDGSCISVYKNGEFFSSSDSGINLTTNSNNLYIGSNGGTTYYFNGSIDDVRIYNRALSSDEIAYLYNTPPEEIQYTSEESMQKLADMAHYSSSVSLSGLPDSYLDGDYYIRSFNFNREGGEPGIYSWNVDLEQA